MAARWPRPRIHASMASPFAPQAGDLLDREQIRECLYRYVRAIDRCDEDLLRSAYWPDARANQLQFSGSRDEFVAWAMPALLAMDSSMHLIGNILMEVRGHTATSEAYFQGMHAFVVDGAARETVMAGRYLDRFEKRDGEWRIRERHVVVDWFRDYADASNWSAGPFGMGYVRGARKPADRSFELFGATH